MWAARSCIDQFDIRPRPYKPRPNSPTQCICSQAVHPTSCLALPPEAAAAQQQVSRIACCRLCTAPLHALHLIPAQPAAARVVQRDTREARPAIGMGAQQPASLTARTASNAKPCQGSSTRAVCCLSPGCHVTL